MMNLLCDTWHIAQAALQTSPLLSSTANSINRFKPEKKGADNDLWYLLEQEENRCNE